MDIDEIQSRLADLESRVRHAEDVLELQRQVGVYAAAADSGETSAAVGTFTEDGTYVFGTEDHEKVSGTEALTSLFDGAGHQSIIGGGSAHIVTPPAIEIDGDEARGTGYSILFRFDGEVPGPEGGDPQDGWRAARVSSVHWTWRRVDGRWLTLDRTNRLLTGSEAARELLGDSFTGDRFTP